MNRSKQGRMGIKANIVLLVGLVFWSIPFAEAEQQGTVPKIAWLTPRINYRFEEFLRELRKLGYVDGKNVSFVRRSFGSEFGRLPALAEELVGLKVDVIVTRGTR
jgi:putative ABC transport system substrate-binding protein